MRIAHVIHAFPPFSRAGAENYAEALAWEQGRRHEVCVFHRISDPTRPEYEVRTASHREIPVVQVNHTFRDLKDFEGTYVNPAVSRAFGVFLDGFRPDVVHFHHVTCLSTTCVQEAADRGIPVVYTLHDFWLLCPRGQLLRRDEALSLCRSHTDTDCVRCMAWQLRIGGGHVRVKKLAHRARRLADLRLPSSLYRRLASRPFRREGAARMQIQTRVQAVRSMCGRVDRFVAPSEFLRGMYARFGIPPERMLLSDYGFDLEPWHRAHSRRVDAQGRLRVAYLGTWIPPKGVHLLLEAFRGLDPDFFVLHLHGHGVPYEGVDGYEERIRKLAAGLPHVRVEGSYAPEDVPRLLARADVVAVPSIWYENSPLTIHEAFLAGVPVVASAQGGMQELVRHEENGLTFRPRSPTSLASALRRLAFEPGLLSRLAPTQSPVKSIGENANELEGLYRELGAGMDGL